ncbi:YjjG family noncanonical pyrimidine nucleotidase [uncultured Polaribacter sp.]|uniref:YjjG family noncanonical pyrimidine nucleotidase n=1 Tax=uncultured Polaribacter sp. TaxID=174711 RepID=UPI00261288AF|nr:YjjG family noncanonical pyrimidine nucleotidase [uncultured Polaribacter sp.]
MKQIEHVFFDLDHTLWDFEKNSDLTFQKVFKKIDIDTNLDAFLAAYKPINFQYWKLFREDKITKQELRYQRLKKAFEAINYSISDEIIAQIAQEYINFLADFNHLFDNALEVLNYLQTKYKLHVITNGFEEIQSKKMINSKIYHYFETIVTSESVNLKKPHPKVFLFALDIASASKEKSIMIGDSVEADVKGALNIGMQAIHCNFRKEILKANDFPSITSLLEIKQYL